MSSKFWIVVALFCIALDTSAVYTGAPGSWAYALFCALWGVLIGLHLVSLGDKP